MEVGVQELIEGNFLMPVTFLKDAAVKTEGVQRTEETAMIEDTRLN